MNIEMIRAARERLTGVAVRTPLMSNPALDRVAGRRVFVKAEALQHTGSFKFRGAWSAISALPPGTPGVIAYSSGNHAQGIARAARDHNLPATIVMPHDAPVAKLEGTRALGAEVVIYDRDDEAREEVGAALAKERGMVLIKPYDEPQVIAGQGTTGLEIAEQAAEAGIEKADVLVCCGGGGLTSGVALALEDMAPGLRARPVEPVGFDDVARSLRSGGIEKNNSTSGSICDAIMTPAPGIITFPIMHRLCGPGMVVPDEDCLRAMALAFAHLKLVLEPGGAIALAAALFHGDQLDGEAVIAVASGGNVDSALFQTALSQYGKTE
ncbi:MAG: threonine/serine dehydratase [Pseudomonadota bacterium]